MSNNLSISTVVSPDILKTISSSVAIITFGDQLVNKAKDKVISVSLGKIQTLKDQIQEIITLQAKVKFNNVFIVLLSNNPPLSNFKGINTSPSSPVG